MSTKVCSGYKDKGSKRLRLRLRLLGTFLLVFFFIVLVVFLLIWAILQPKKPLFIIQDATLYSFNVTSTPNLFTSNFQVTISSRNPNDKIGIYYDKLDVYASYRSQQITYYTAIPPVYQGHKTVNTWSPFVTGTSVPISPFNGEALTEDQANGAILLMIKINGRVRWKVGTFVSGRYHLHVTCPAYIPCGNNNTNIIVGTAVKYQLAENCKVSL